MSAHILVVDDEADLLMSLDYSLKQLGFSVATAQSGRQCLLALQTQRPDLIVLDLQLPDFSGTEICRKLKGDPQTAAIPILMLTAKGEEEDRLSGLEAGANDYVLKPFSTRELGLRIKSLLRRVARNQQGAVSEALTFGPLEVDTAAHRVQLHGEEVELTALEFKLLLTFLERKGKVQSRDALLRDVWGYQGDVMTRTVDTNVKRLRQKLERGGDWIETVRGVGYRFSETP